MTDQQNVDDTDSDNVSCCVRGAAGLVRPHAADWFAGVLNSGQTLHSWASESPNSQLAHGRGAVYVVESPFRGRERGSRLVVRHYHRGGRIASLLRDRYLRVGMTRPESEARVSAEARRRGVRTPEVIAAAWYSAGLFYRGDLVTEMVPGSRTLASLLFAPERSPHSSDALAKAGRLARDLAAKGILHADLNAMNVLINRQAGEITAHVIDLDRARLVDPGPGRAMVERLERSLAKFGKASARPLTVADWEALRDGMKGEE